MFRLFDQHCGRALGEAAASDGGPPLVAQHACLVAANGASGLTSSRQYHRNFQPEVDL
jgi:hypothetical protein